jgi:hypothetical protein
MAAFCVCCGAEITLKAEACPVCGTPQHGMWPQTNRLMASNADADFQETKARSAGWRQLSTT